MPRRPDLPCADCGTLLWRGTTSLPEGQARCQPCRRANPHRAKRKRKPNLPRLACVECGSPSWGIRCRKCRGVADRMRSSDDPRVRRWMRAVAAPGLPDRARRALLTRWKQQGRTCAYCTSPPTTIDHVLPLVRGGTNYEGNLAPCCKWCNSSKAGLTLIEWRTGQRITAMTDPLPWVHMPPLKPKPKRQVWIQTVLKLCPICTAMHMELGACCSTQCIEERNRRRTRDQYRTRKGLPVDPSKPTKPWLRLLEHAEKEPAFS